MVLRGLEGSWGEVWSPSVVMWSEDALDPIVVPGILSSLQALCQRHMGRLYL